MNQEQYYKQCITFLNDCKTNRHEFKNFYQYPILNEDTPSHAFDPHYVYHVAWAIKKISLASPEMHVDFSSSLHFCSVLPAWCKTKFYDFRPASLVVEGLECDSCDLTSPFFDVGCYASVSCMHVVEHIGLGRYGDALDVNGDLKAIENLKNSVLVGGDLYFVVPCGQPSIHFNAHRVYAVESVCNYFKDQFDLVELYFIPGPVDEPPIRNPDISLTLKYPYGCGCFHFKRR